MQQSAKDMMITGSIWRKIIRFAIPVFLGELFQQMYNAVDSLIVGNYLGSNSLAAVSSAGSLIFLFIGFFNGLSMGAGVAVSQFLGAGDKEGTQQAVHTKVALGLASSAFLTVFGILVTPLMLRLMGTPSEVLPESIAYFRFYFAGSVGLVMYNALVGILQAAGDSRHPLVYLIISSLTNIVLDLLFIGVFHWGVAGAAIATSISQVLSAALCLIRLMRIDADYRVEIRKIRFHKTVLKTILRYGVPSGIQNSVMSLSNVVIQSYINSFGRFAMAGIGAISKIEGFANLPVRSFSLALTTFVGQNIGAREYDRVKKGVRFGLATGLLLAEFLGLLVFIFAPDLIALYDTNPEVIAYGVARARVIMLLNFLMAATHLLAAVLRGMGKSTPPMLVTLLCWCVGRILILTASNLVGLHVIEVTYWVYPITWLMSTTVLLIYYLRIDFTRIDVSRHNSPKEQK